MHQNYTFQNDQDRISTKLCGFNEQQHHQLQNIFNKKRLKETAAILSVMKDSRETATTSKYNRSYISLIVWRYREFYSPNGRIPHAFYTLAKTNMHNTPSIWPYVFLSVCLSLSLSLSLSLLYIVTRSP